MSFYDKKAKEYIRRISEEFSIFDEKSSPDYDIKMFNHIFGQ